MTSEQLKILVDTVQQLSLARDINAVMNVVRTSARNLTKADGATFVLKDGELCYYADEDAIEPLWKGQRFPMSACISGWAMIHCQPAVVPDIYHDDRIPIEAYKPTFVKSLVTVPIRTISPLGAIGNYWGTHHTPTDEEVQLLQSLADITSVSIENVYVYQELEERVHKRTEQLETANKEMEAFSYSVSHDLRSPLTAISGFTELLSRHLGNNVSDKAKHYMKNIAESALWMGKLIDDLLNFSKIGRQELMKSFIDMNSLTMSVINDINNSTPNQAEIKIENLHSAYGDYNLIRQVMINLLSNAIKYSSKKENPRVGIESVEQDVEIVYIVKDNGVGFDMNYSDKLFDVFQRLHSDKEFEGTGVGLAIVKQIISKHGGKIWAEAKVNEGATFYFSLKSDVH